MLVKNIKEIYYSIDRQQRNPDSRVDFKSVKITIHCNSVIEVFLKTSVEIMLKSNGVCNVTLNFRRIFLNDRLLLHFSSFYDFKFLTKCNYLRVSDNACFVFFHSFNFNSYF